MPILLMSIITLINLASYGQTYKIVGTDATSCYDNYSTITCPLTSSDAFYGQFSGLNSPNYQDNGDGTVLDLVTGLMWQSSPDINGNNNGIITEFDALRWDYILLRLDELNSTNYGGYNDWRIPTIKQLYSLSNYKGNAPREGVVSTAGLNPFIDTTFFPFEWGRNEDSISYVYMLDVKYASSTISKDKSYYNSYSLYGMNFADGRILGYQLTPTEIFNFQKFMFIAVRGNLLYGSNDFVDNGDLTITDKATGLMWSKDDSKFGMQWQDALAWAQTQNSSNYCGYSDWRLPNAKELQSIVDYDRSPISTQSASIDSIFNISTITSEAGTVDWPYFWTSTTQATYNGSVYEGKSALYVAFGRASGWAKGAVLTYFTYCDLDCTGAVRSEVKTGSNYGVNMGVDLQGNPIYSSNPRGDNQGEIARLNNYVRLVRNDNNSIGIGANQNFNDVKIYPNPTTEKIQISGIENAQIEIYNSLGQAISGFSILNSDVIVDLTNYSSGIYIVKISKGNEMIVKKIIKK